VKCSAVSDARVAARTSQGRARFGRARAEVRRGGSGPTRTKGNKVAHGSTLARTVAEGSATRQG
jgi:hypothetical protein